MDTIPTGRPRHRRAPLLGSRLAPLALLALVALVTGACEGIAVATPTAPALPSAAPITAGGPSATPAQSSDPSVVASAGGVRADWPTYLGTPDRTGTTTDQGLTAATVGSLVPRLQVKLGGPIATQPIVVGNTAYVGAWDGNEYAIDITTGSIVWKRFLGLTTNKLCGPATLGVTSTPTVLDGVVYLGGGGPFWYALDAATGAIRWKVPTGDNSAKGGYYNWSSPLIWQGAAYIGIASDCDLPTVRGELLRVDLTTHKVTARFEAVPAGQHGGGVWQTPAIDATTNTIFITTGNFTLAPAQQPLAQALVALDATTLHVLGRWQIPARQSIKDGDWGTTPVLYQDATGRSLVAVANKNGNLYAFQRSGLGAGPVWTRQIAGGGDCPDCGQGTVSTPAFADGKLFAAGGKTVIGGAQRIGSIRAIDGATGAVVWERGFDHAVIPAVAAVNGMVLLGVGPDFDILSAADGSILFTYHTGPETYGAPSVAQGMVFIGSVDGTLWAFGPPTQ